MNQPKSPAEHQVSPKPQPQETNVFRYVSISQLCVHVMAYLAAFFQLIVVQRGGYSDIGTIFFIGISVVSLPIILISVLLIKNAYKLSSKFKIGAYIFYGIILAWSILMIKISYFM